MAHEPDYDAVGFICERLRQSWRRWESGDPDFSKRDEDWKRIHLELMRSDTIILRPGDPFRLMLADNLEKYYFPSKKRDRKELREAKALAYRDMIERFAKEGNISKAKAKLKVVAFFNLKTVEALNLRLWREKRERKKADKS